MDNSYAYSSDSRYYRVIAPIGTYANFVKQAKSKRKIIDKVRISWEGWNETAALVSWRISINFHRQSLRWKEGRLPLQKIVFRNQVYHLLYSKQHSTTLAAVVPFSNRIRCTEYKISNSVIASHHSFPISKRDQNHLGIITIPRPEMTEYKRWPSPRKVNRCPIVRLLWILKQNRSPTHRLVEKIQISPPTRFWAGCSPFWPGSSIGLIVPWTTWTACLVLVASEFSALSRENMLTYEQKPPRIAN